MRKNYFSEVLQKNRGQKGERGRQCLEANKSAVSTVSSFTPLHDITGGQRETNIEPLEVLVFPFSPLTLNKGGNSEGAETPDSPLVPLFPPEKVKDFYEERAAIFEYEGGLTRKEAEDMAYRYALREFVKDHYPKIIGQFETMVFDNRGENTRNSIFQIAKEIIEIFCRF